MGSQAHDVAKRSDHYKTLALRDFISREYQRIEQIAEFGSVSKGTVYKAVKEGQLPVKKYTARLFRVRTVDALKWLGIDFSEDTQ
ncbi:hypothetical protein GCM10008959_24280 [Deinococcus seoulensis]|uniref:Helix-turn-helix domain-containing protein n=1 Tax=Deinococcus seoulensis TaxID=1837379 RepID=A0ABQ2RVU4_9DEIO|nr:hypothetical protein [Deinococcus seoulensis]GGR61548.1 hypothetical protein GCM10008959_24280 [Deinococcus seoulensis]